MDGRARRISAVVVVGMVTVGVMAAAAAPAAATADEDGEEAGGFATSSVCERCHANSPRATAMRDGKEREVAPFLLWSGSMMANSFRDVVWRAAVSAEVAANPSHAEEIARECMRCHAPMAARALDPAVTSRQLQARGDAAPLARDGVSCTVCHRIAAEGLGSPATFGGRFPLNDGEELYGPHDDLFARPMLHHSGFMPARAEHVLRSALCATCHTLRTATLRPDGTAAGVSFLEQAPYLEWRNSDFNDEVAAPTGLAASCQDCHMPVRGVDGDRIETRIARNPGGRDFPPTDPRRPFGRHLLVGGNALVPRLLASQAAPIAPEAGAEALEATARAAEEQLAERTATVEVDDVERRGRRIGFDVHVANLTGHKFPTAHPARRAWLRVRVVDAAGKVLFASGEHDRAGRILGGDGAPLPFERPGAPHAPHRAVVRGPGEVQVYELAMSDGEGAPTHGLLRAARAAKDDRLLPMGWSPEHPDAAATRPVGVDGDGDFTAGGDAVRYEVELPAGARPARVEATLLYQTLGARHAAEILQAATPEARELEGLLAASGNAPSLVARGEARVR